MRPAGRRRAGTACDTPSHAWSSWQALDAARGFLSSPVSEETLPGERAGDTEAEIVVPVRWFVPVAVRRAEILRIVVPGTAAVDAIGAGSLTGGKTSFPLQACSDSGAR